MTNAIRAKVDELRAAVLSGSTKYTRANVAGYIVIAQLTQARLRPARHVRVDVYAENGKRLTKAEAEKVLA